MDPNIDPTTTSDITPDPARVTPTLPDDDDDSSDVAAPQPSSGQPSPQVPRPTSIPQSQPSSPATAPANALKPSSSSQVHGVLGGVLMGALEGAARKVGQGLKKAVPYIPVAAKAQRVHQEAQQQEADQQQDAQLKKQKAGQEATAAMDKHTLDQINYNNATLTNHHLVEEAQEHDAAKLQAQSDLARSFKDALKQQGIDLDSDHGAGHGGLTTQDATDVAQGKTVHLFNGANGADAGVEILNTADLNQPLLHDIKMPLKMEIDPKTGKLVATDEQTIKADGHNTVQTAFSAFQNSQRMGVQAQTEFDQQQKNIKAASDAKKAGEEKPEAEPKTVPELSIAQSKAQRAYDAAPTLENKKVLDAAKADLNQVIDTEVKETEKKHAAGEEPLTPEEIKGYEEGRLTMTPYILGRHPELVRQIMSDWPDYDMTLGEKYADLRGEFTKGKTGAQINSFNTALNHIGAMWPHLNTLSATKGAQDLAAISGDKDADAVNTIREVLAGELGRSYKQGVLSKDELDDFKKLLGGRTVNEAKNNLQTFVELLNGKLDGFQNQWRTGKPSTRMADFPIISPQAQQVINMVSGKGGAVQQIPTRPTNVPSNYTFSANGPHGRGWYDPSLLNGKQ